MTIEFTGEELTVLVGALWIAQKVDRKERHLHHPLSVDGRWSAALDELIARLEPVMVHGGSSAGSDKTTADKSES